MQLKTINKIIEGKVNQWCASIKDEALAARVHEDVIVTGGCITSMLLDEPVNDFDVYFGSVTTARLIAQYYTAQFHNENPKTPLAQIRMVDANGDYDFISDAESDHVQVYIKSVGYLKADGLELRTLDFDAIADIQQQTANDSVNRYRPIFLSSNAITLSNQMQLVMRFCGPPSEVHKSFDFDHAKQYWTLEDGIVTNKRALQSILERRLSYSGSLYPLCSILRVKKFIQRGWTINAGQMVKMMLQVNSLQLNDPKVLVDQLTGVDTSYFTAIINKACKTDNLNPDGSIDMEFFLQVIDEVFEG